MFLPGVLLEGRVKARSIREEKAAPVKHNRWEKLLCMPGGYLLSGFDRSTKNTERFKLYCKKYFVAPFLVKDDSTRSSERKIEHKIQAKTAQMRPPLPL